MSSASGAYGTEFALAHITSTYPAIWAYPSSVLQEITNALGRGFRSVDEVSAIVSQHMGVASSSGPPIAGQTADYAFM